MNIDQVISKLEDIKKQHGNIPVVVEACYSGNYWLASTTEVRISRMHPEGDRNREEIPVVEIVGE
nr:hypothetical protein MarFTME_263 [Marseillevirus futianmevirus]